MLDRLDARGIDAFRWLGRDAMHLDVPAISTCGRVRVACYGGHTSAGADKNEDAALVWSARDGSWELAVLADAHYSAESAALILVAVSESADAILDILARPLEVFAETLHAFFLALFRAPAFRARCQQVEGEASCIICARRAQFLWWFSVGDCVLYLFHPELARLGQFAVNQRSFFEWIGRRNTFDLVVPCYTCGSRELLYGQNRILLATDGLLECGGQPFSDPMSLYRLFGPGARHEPAVAARSALTRVHQERGRDSATLITWGYDVQSGMR